MNKETILELIDKFQNGTISPTEKRKLIAWYCSTAYQKATYPTDEITVKSRMLFKLMDEAGYMDLMKRKQRKRLKYGIAASLLFFLGINFTWWIISLPDPPDNLIAKKGQIDYRPATNTVQLRLADGTYIDLDDQQSGLMVNGVITYQDGSEISGLEKVNTSKTPIMELVVPSGRQYQLELADGSKVWLNAGSSLKYPPLFDDSIRVVALSGEGYFLIRKDEERPFKVISTGQEVQVIGTEFNISAYPDDPETTTTLVEGSVRITSTEGRGVTVRLQPGEQSIVRGTNLEIKRVDIEEYITWKSGRFNFDGKSFTRIMADISRWYDIEVVYEGKIPSETFFGDAFRTDNLSLILRLLENSHIDYKLTKDKKLIITNDKEKRKEAN